jgi:hypothetical protein
MPIEARPVVFFVQHQSIGRFSSFGIVKKQQFYLRTVFGKDTEVDAIFCHRCPNGERLAGKDVLVACMHVVGEFDK